MTTADLFTAAMHLPDDLRAELVVRLMDSLDTDTSTLPEAEWERLWGIELASRIKAIDSGEMKTIPAAEAMEMVRARLQAIREG